MLPLQFLRVILSGKARPLKWKGISPPHKSNFRLKLGPPKIQIPKGNFHVKNPFQTLFKDLSTGLSQIAKKPVVEDYNTVVRRFVPQGARLLKPQLPFNSQTIDFADIDGDSKSELITSFKHNGQVRTIALKKQNGAWYKLSEIYSPECDSISYRSFADLSGEGKQHLLLGLPSSEKGSTLYGYLLDNGNLNELFSRNYSRFELLNQPQRDKATSKSQLAFWNKDVSGTYNVDVLDWNGQQLQPIHNDISYYSQRMVPFCARKVKREPYTPSNWYNLANCLEKAGAYEDALTAIEAGMYVDSDSSFKDDFINLRNKINEKL